MHRLAGLGLAAALALAPAGGGSAGAAFDFAQVAAAARALASEPYREPSKVPDWLMELGYDAWRGIRFRPERALWRTPGARFEVQLLHPGMLYDRSVEIDVVDAQGVHRLPFSTADFDYGASNLASRVPQDLGYAGFRVHYPLAKPTYRDEVIVFLGASYFRAVGRGEGFGLSARGLAIDTALPSGEEFPYFRRFWLVRPAPDAQAIEIYALLDSPSLAGAYRFVVTPGDATRVEVRARLFPRRAVQKLGIAPLTSMFLHGENSTRCTDDFRPEVHDSDGVLLGLRESEWLWRPLDNPERLQVNAFATERLRGFGLAQRDRAFDHYQDLEARPDQRPSVWIEPEGDWGGGSVELVEIPTDDDTHDNIVAYWVPAQPSEPDRPLDFGYTMRWYGSDPALPPLGAAVATRRDRPEGAVHRFVVDFAGGALTSVPAARVPRAAVSTRAPESEQAELLDQQLLRNPVDGSWRLVFRVRVRGAGPFGLRAHLEHEGEPLTETWSYSLIP